MDKPIDISHRQVLRQAWPLILANCTVPLLGLADTAVLGNFGSVTDLGAIALGSLIFSFLYWGFGFLRMGTTGFIAQADGRGEEAEIRAVILRALLLALVIAAALLVIQIPAVTLAFSLLNGSELVETTAGDYFAIRIWGAPATLGTFVVIGALVGLGESRKLLGLQVLLNFLNITLDIYCAGDLMRGAEGIAAGTLLAEWTAFAVGLLMVWRLMRGRQQDPEPFLVPDRLRNRKRLLSLLTANSDIMIRTLLLVFSFAWFTNQSAGFGDVTLAATHVLLQLIAFSAFFLDGFAFVGESLVGRAIGACNRRALHSAIRKTTEIAAVTATLLAVLVLGAGQFVVMLLTNIEAVRSQAAFQMSFAAAYIFLSFAAFQLDGIFIGATLTRQMRNASLAATAWFMLAWMVLTPRFGITGLWLACITCVCARAVALLYYFPSVVRQIRRDSD